MEPAGGARDLCRPAIGRPPAAPKQAAAIDAARVAAITLRKRPGQIRAKGKAKSGSRFVEGAEQLRFEREMNVYRFLGPSR
jgi:hypothetical protein